MSTYAHLHDYLLRRMRMSHVAVFPFSWGPVMIQALLEGGGARTERDIARTLMAFDGRHRIAEPPNCLDE